MEKLNVAAGENSYLVPENFLGQLLNAAPNGSPLEKLISKFYQQVPQSYLSVQDVENILAEKIVEETQTARNEAASAAQNLYEPQLEELKASNARLIEVNASLTEDNTRLTEVGKTLGDELTKTQREADNFATQLGEVRLELVAVKERLDQKHREELEQIRQNHESALGDLQAVHQRELTEQQEQRQSVLEDLNRAHQAKIAELGEIIVGYQNIVANALPPIAPAGDPSIPEPTPTPEPTPQPPTSTWGEKFDAGFDAAWVRIFGRKNGQK